MNELEKTLLRFDDKFKEVGLDYFIHGSTLLGIVRGQGILNRIVFDQEHNFGCLAEDLTPGMVRKLQDVFPHYFQHGPMWENSLIYLAEQKPEKDIWEMKDGFGLLAGFHKTRTKRVENMNHDIFKWWPANLIDDKSKWGVVKILGREFKTPIDYEAWFNHYFGKDWRNEKIGWHWSRDAENITDLRELRTSGEIPNDNPYGHN